eukprot:3033966-Rhodomonas_salina.5
MAELEDRRQSGVTGCSLLGARSYGIPGSRMRHISIDMESSLHREIGMGTRDWWLETPAG